MVSLFIWKEEKQLSHVHFLPFKARSELAKYYVASDVFVLFSRGDTWGLVVNEAMSYGLPVVSSDKCVAGIELVENGVNGFVVPLEDEQQIYEILSDLVCDSEKCQKFGEASLQKIGSYTIENMAEIVFSYLERN